MDAFNESYPALQMLAKMRVSFPVLTVRTMTDTIRQDRLQQIEVCSSYIEPLIGYQPGKMLAYRLAHDSRLAVLNAETFIDKNRSRPGSEALCRTVEVF